MWHRVNDRFALVCLASFFVLLTLHLSTFESPMAEGVDELEPGERAELLLVVDERWEVDKGTMMWASDMRGELIRVFAGRNVEAPEEGELTIFEGTISDDRGILFAESFRSPYDESAFM